MTAYAYIGIDPGLDGAICLLLASGNAKALVVPTIASGKGAKRLYDVPAMVAILRDWKAAYLIGLAALEKGRAAPGQGVTSMFRFGHGCGLWEGILAALKIPYALVHPNAWQKSICAGLSGDAKARAVQAVSSRLPELELRKSDRARKPHQGTADAACLALHAYQLNVGGK